MTFNLEAGWRQKENITGSDVGENQDKNFFSEKRRERASERRGGKKRKRKKRGRIQEETKNESLGQSSGQVELQFICLNDSVPSLKF